MKKPLPANEERRSEEKERRPPSLLPVLALCPQLVVLGASQRLIGALNMALNMTTPLGAQHGAGLPGRARLRVEELNIPSAHVLVVHNGRALRLGRRRKGNEAVARRAPVALADDYAARDDLEASKEAHHVLDR